MSQAVQLWACCSAKVCESQVFLWSGVMAVSRLAHGITELVTSPAKESAAIAGVKLQSAPAQAPKEPSPSWVRHLMCAGACFTTTCPISNGDVHISD